MQLRFYSMNYENEVQKCIYEVDVAMNDLNPLIYRLGWSCRLYVLGFCLNFSATVHAETYTYRGSRFF